MSAQHFALDRKGLAHVVQGNIMTSLCGAEAWLPAGTQGVPCPKCLNTAAHLAVTELPDPLQGLGR